MGAFFESAYAQIVVLLQSVVSLYIVVNPAGVASVFLGVTKNLEPWARRRVAFRAVIAGGLTLAAFAFAGSYLFSLFKITGAALQIAGGILVFGFASALARGKESEFFGAVQQDAEKAHTSVGLYPLAVPLIAGPSSITVVMTLSAKSTDPESRLVLIVSIAVVAALCLLSMLRYLSLSTRGRVLALVLPRIMGLILAVIAVQFVIEGVAAVLPDLVRAGAAGLEERSKPR